MHIRSGNKSENTVNGCFEGDSPRCETQYNTSRDIYVDRKRARNCEPKEEGFPCCNEYCVDVPNDSSLSSTTSN